MAKGKSNDPFVSSELPIEVGPATSRVLKQRMKTADQGRLISAEKARQRMQEWLSKSSTTQTRQPILKTFSIGTLRLRVVSN